MRSAETSTGQIIMGIVKTHSGLFSNDSNEWRTPTKLFEELNNEFHFTLDPSSTHENAKCKKHYTEEDDGLSKSWDGETVYCNPPYGRVIAQWVKKSSEIKGGTVVMLLPARTDTGWFHDYILGKAEIRFIRGRLNFNDGKGKAPFPSIIVIFRNRGKNG